MKCLNRNSHCVNVCIFTIHINVISVIFVALCTDDKDTPVLCDKCFRDFWRWAYVLISHQSHLMFLLKEHDFSILYGTCFFESFSLFPNYTGIRHRLSWKLYSKFASCFRTRLSAFHISIVNIRMSQIAIITITTLTALMSNNNHIQ